MCHHDHRTDRRPHTGDKRSISHGEKSANNSAGEVKEGRSAVCERSNIGVDEDEEAALDDGE